jgi:hypothetical protein
MTPPIDEQILADEVLRASFTDKRWTLMASLLGTNTALLLFQGIQQEAEPMILREVALTWIAITLPFQAIYFMIHTYVLVYSDLLQAHEHHVLQLLSGLCQIIAYLSVLGIALLWYNMSHSVGFAFIVSSIVALILVRLAMSQAAVLAIGRLEE